MSKQQKTYLLLVLVISIWGLIGYNIYSYKNPVVEITTPVTNKSFVEKKRIPEIKALNLSNYRDPFLGKIVKNKKNRNLKQPKTQINFPTIIYHGLVNANNVKSYIISINNQQEIFKVRKSFNRVKLISGNSKEILVEFQGIRKSIKRQK